MELVNRFLSFVRWYYDISMPAQLLILIPILILSLNAPSLPPLLMDDRTVFTSHAHLRTLCLDLRSM